MLWVVKKGANRNLPSFTLELGIHITSSLDFSLFVNSAIESMELTPPGRGHENFTVL
jgi:hypothetical protein